MLRLIALIFCVSLAASQPILENTVPDLGPTELKEENQRAGGSGGPFPTDVSSLGSGFGPLMNTMKDGKLVIGGFSFVVIPNPDPSQIASMAGGAGGIPFVSSLPGSG